MQRLLKWISGHRYASAVLATAVIAVAVGISLRARRIDGASLSEPLARGPVVESVYGIGTVAANRSFQLRSGVTSTIEKLYVKEGDRVKRGDRLADLEGDAHFRAPFDGTVTLLPSKVGETVFAQSVILSLVDLSDRYVVVTLEQRGILRVRPGMRARISFDSMRSESFEGAVEAIYSNDTSFLVRIGVEGLPPQVLPGMSADVAIGVAERTDALLVPVAALQGRTLLVSRDGGRPRPVEVTTGVVDGEMAEILSGDVREGDRVALRRKSGP